MKNNYKEFYAPIKMILVYLIGTELLYFFGPLNWDTKNIIILVLFLFLSNLLLFLGYKSTISRFIIKEINEKKKYEFSVLNNIRLLKYLRVMIPLNLIMTIANLLRYTGLDISSMGQIFNNLILGVTNPGSQYSEKFENSSLFGGNILAPISTILAPILWPVLVLSLINFKKISFINKIFILLTIFFEITRWVSIGTNKGVLDIILILISVYILKKNERESNKIKQNNNKRLTFFVILFLILGLYFFSLTISSRTGDSSLILQSISNNTTIDTNSIIFKIVPDVFKTLLIYVTLYLTQGYQGLSLTFSESFIPMFGIGNSNFLIENIKQLFNNDLFINTYQNRIQYTGWDAQLNWHSIYSWIANDISYLGVLVLMFFMGKYIAVIYFRSIKYDDPLSIVLFSLMITMIFYFPMNNQILAMPNTFMVFWTFNIILFLKKINIKIN